MTAWLILLEVNVRRTKIYLSLKMSSVPQTVFLRISRRILLLTEEEDYLVVMVSNVSLVLFCEKYCTLLGVFFWKEMSMMGFTSSSKRHGLFLFLFYFISQDKVDSSLCWCKILNFVHLPKLSVCLLIYLL